MDINFENEKKINIEKMSKDQELNKLSNKWICETAKHKYTYNFSWLGLPIIQFPQDILAMQEIIWRIKPDLIIETGIARGGSLVFYASMLEFLNKGEVIGIDIDIRAHNRKAIEEHPMSKRIKLVEGSSISKETIEKVKEFAKNKKCILVCLDSNHTHQHVLEELKLYSQFVTKESYCVVFDTVIEDMPDNLFNDRPWKQGDNAKTAVHEFLNSDNRFALDKDIENKLLITVCPDGFLKRVI